MKKLYAIVSTVTFIGIILIIVYFSQFYDRACLWNSQFREKIYVGVVVDKYIDYEYSAGKNVILNDGSKLIIGNSWFEGYTRAS